MQDRRRISQARRLDHDSVEGQFARRAPVDQPFQRLQQIAAHRAAHAAGGQEHRLLPRLDDQVVVEADIAELVHHHGDAARRGIAQKRVHRRGFPGAKTAGDQGQGDS